MITDEVIAEGLRLDEERTPGIWMTGQCIREMHQPFCQGDCRNLYVSETHADICSPCAIMSEEDATFTAHAAKHYADALREIRRLRERLNQQVADECDDDTRIRELARPFTDVEGDSYGVPGIVDIVESLVKLIPNRKESTDA